MNPKTKELHMLVVGGRKLAWSFEAFSLERCFFGLCLCPGFV